MKFATFEQDGRAVTGWVENDQLVALPPLSPRQDMAAWLMQSPDRVAQAVQQARRDAANLAPLSKARLLPAVPQPGKIVCLGLNYADHAAEGGHAKPDYPSFFMRGASSLVAHGAPMVRPRVSGKFDFEAELAVVVGRRARHLTAGNALDAVAGYTCFNDGSLRDYQRKTSQWTIGKNFDGTGALGPWVVPASELPPGAVGLKIQSRLNGAVMQSSDTSLMLSPVVEALCLLTEAMTLEPGDVIAMGTPSGVGHARQPPVWMKAGDTIEVEIERIGILSNPVVDEPSVR
ncbi:fumarylacetoacetate hydrolase family protein [Ramlibacter sp.]|uniref:fumarylacetoacetate hydrolase family protein n=1 Tax=Ramlibacter sp. TaxID=1917967 RepID=UPI002BF357A9|nr:fumarylacetoacetate hydrolase family protein [Ramlibacter sp.]HWI82949.1 fumarylacetoacetate hydrolase family protein [Ramlibacter sp.]